MRHIVITSIHPPNKAIEGFAAMADSHVVVAGDLKSPSRWEHPNCTFLDAKAQKKLPHRIVEYLPWNHYGRKMLGYLHAIGNGATEIMDTDDDNVPYPGHGFPPDSGTFATTRPGLDFVNIYRGYTSQPIWPRGLPLDQIQAVDDSLRPENLEPAQAPIGFWQGLADLDPDVDAIYRLTSNKPVTFDKGPPIVLAEGTWCPFNSQNTLCTRPELFPLLYLPAFVTFRFTDILRGYVAQPILQAAGYRLGFTGATVFQERNEHDLMRDFQDEIPFYLHARKCMSAVVAAVRTESSITDNLLAAYKALHAEGIVQDEELPLLEAWIEDVSNLG